MDARNYTAIDETSIRYDGWRIVVVCFLLATFGWGLGFYGQSVYVAELQRLHGWPASLISSGTTVFYLFGAALVVFVSEAIDVQTDCAENYATPKTTEFLDERAINKLRAMMGWSCPSSVKIGFPGGARWRRHPDSIQWNAAKPRVKPGKRVGQVIHDASSEGIRPPLALYSFHSALRNLHSAIRILLTALLLAASSHAQAAVEIPVGDIAQPIAIRASGATHWRQGAYEVWILRGAVRIDQGTVAAKSDEAVLWIDRAERIEDVPAAAFDTVDAGGDRAVAPRVVRLAGAVLPVLSPTALDPGPLVQPSGTPAP